MFYIYVIKFFLAAPKQARLSPTGDPFGNPNLKWVSNTIPIASNRVPI